MFCENKNCGNVDQEKFEVFGGYCNVCNYAARIRKITRKEDPLEYDAAWNQNYKGSAIFCLVNESWGGVEQLRQAILNQIQNNL
jgi:hypothetical protein